MSTPLESADTLDGVIAALSDGLGPETKAVILAAATLILGAFDGPQGVRKLSPIDRGEYKSGHTLTVGSPSSFTPPHIDPPSRLPHSGQLPEYLAIQESQLGVARGELLKLLTLKAGSVDIFITNNVEYAGDLEHGTSSQAPTGIYTVAEQALTERLLSISAEGVSVNIQNPFTF